MQGADDADNYSSLPLEDRLTHKLWKARLEAYDELAKLFAKAEGPKDPLFRTHWEAVRSMPAESNAAALESALGCLLAFLQSSDAATKMRPMVLPGLIEKCLNASKPGVRSKCLEAVLYFVEVDCAEPVLAELAAFLGHKQPKLVAACLNAMVEIIKDFGADKVTVKAAAKAVSPAFQHADKNVRAEGISLAIELYRWAGPAISPFLETLKPIQLKELQDQFSKVVVGACRPRRLPKSQQGQLLFEPVVNEPAQCDQMDVEEPGGAVDVSPLDPYDLADPVNVLDKIPGTFADMMESTKWKDRKDALDELSAVLKTPKIEEGHFGPLVQTLVRRLADANILVVISAAGCLENLARGLRKAFAPYRVEVVPAVLERTKEKKQNVLDALRACLDAMSKHSLPSMYEMIDLLSPPLAHKNPQVKAECLSWLARSQTKPGTKKDVKALLAVVLPTLEDSSPEVREASSKLVAAVIARSGETNVAPFLDTVDKAKLAKILDQAKSLAAPTSTAGSAKRSAPPSTPAKATSVKNVFMETAIKATPKVQPASKQAKKEAAGPAVLKHSDEEAVALFESVLSAAAFAGLADSNWKARLESLEEILRSFSTAIPDGVDCELLVRFLGKRPGWKESNFQVYQRTFQLIRVYINARGVQRETVCLLAPPAADKLGDIKIGPEASETLLVCAEFTGLGWVLEQVCSCLKAQKSPKNQAEALKWIRSAILTFGASNVGNVVELVEAIKAQITSSNPLVRSAAISVAACLRQCLGPDVRAFFADLSAPILSSLDAEFEKAAKEAAPKPTRFPRAADAAPSSQDATQMVEGSPSDLASMIDRTDLVVPGEVIAMLSDAKWQNRKEALDGVASLVDKAHKKIKLANGDLLNELKGRFSDSNKNIVIQALELTGVVGEACGAAFEKHLKTILAGVIATLSDNKLQVRQAALKCLESLNQACRLSSFLPTVLSSIAGSESPNLRKEVLQWTASAIKERQATKDDLVPLVSTCLACLQDRTMEVRKAAQGTLSACLVLVPPDQVKRMCQEQKPAMLGTVQGLIDAFAASNAGSSQSQSQPTRRIIGSGLFMAADGDAKAERAEKDRAGNSWSFEVPRKETIDLLKAQMAGHIHGPLVAALFSDDFKDHINGLGQMETALTNACPEERQVILWNLDLLLKYLSIRFFDTNMSVFLKCTDLMEKLLAMVDAANARFTEHEASCFLPFFIGKAGETKDALRTRVKAIFRQLCRIYPASKLFGYLVEGLKSKSARCRSGCLEEMNALLGRNGLVVINPPKHIPLVASMISDRDPQTRTAALDVMVRLVGLMGDQLSKYLSELGQKEMDLLEERLKHRPSQDEPVEQPDVVMEDAEPAESAPANPNEKGPFSLDYEQFNTADRDRMMAVCTSTPMASSRLAEATPPHPFAPKAGFTFDEHPIDRLVHAIQTSADLQCIHALQRLEEYLSPPSDDLRARTNAIITALTVRLHECSLIIPIDTDRSMKSRLCRYVTNALVVICSEADLMAAINQDTLILVLNETLVALTSAQLSSFEDHDQLVRALNILLVKALETSSRNQCYHALLVLLEQAFRLPPAEGEKYPEFVMKCLWKMTKQIPAHLEHQQLAVDALLLDIHNFFCALPPLEWKTRANQRLPFEDLPLRTVKTILHELVVVKGSNVMFQLGLIHNSEQSFVTSYLKAMLQAIGLDVPTMPIQMSEPEEAEASKGPTSSTELAPVEVEAILKDICGKICSKPNTRTGLTELFAFQQANPSAAAQIDAYLEQLGSFFYKYIKRNLQQLQVEQKMSAHVDIGEYKSKLANLQHAFAQSTAAPASLMTGGLVTGDPSQQMPDQFNSPLRTRLESPLLKAAHSPRPMPVTVKDSSIVNLKERLAKLRTSSTSQQQP